MFFDTQATNLKPDFRTLYSEGSHFSSLSRPANKISLLEIYKAVEAPPVFSIHHYPKERTCRTSCTHKQAMVELLEDTQRAFEARLGQRMLSEMVAKARSYK
jgi:DNA-binding IscR family transcriptional regulator